MTDTVVHGHPALTDTLTGLPNRLHFETVYCIVIRAVDRGLPVSLAILEIDGMEKYLEARGRSGTEDLVRFVADRFRRTTRGADLLARVGDGRFFLLLFDCNPQGARIAADRFQDQLDIEEEPDLSVSVGVASANRDETYQPNELITFAERALEQAQSFGPRSVELFSGPS